MSLFKRVTIIGLGLIGGSLGLAIREKHLAGEIVGVSRRRSTIRRARALRVVDRATLDLRKGVRDSDFIIVAAPVLKIIDILTSISRYLKKGAIITDVGSTKNVIVRDIEQVLSDGVDFIGGHPLAGSELSGVTYSDKDLFKGAYCILTKTPRTNAGALTKVGKFWTKLGMKTEIMSPERHDRVISRLSHLPHAAAVAVSNTCGKRELDLAAGGFKDVTRIASGSPWLWRDIFVTNRDNIARDIKVFKKELLKIEKALKGNNSRELLKLLKRAKAVRDAI